MPQIQIKIRNSILPRWFSARWSLQVSQVARSAADNQTLMTAYEEMLNFQTGMIHLDSFPFQEDQSIYICN